MIRTVFKRTALMFLSLTFMFGTAFAYADDSAAIVGSAVQFGSINRAAGTSAKKTLSGTMTSITQTEATASTISVEWADSAMTADSVYNVTITPYFEGNAKSVLSYSTFGEADHTKAIQVANLEQGTYAEVRVEKSGSSVDVAELKYAGTLPDSVSTKDIDYRYGSGSKTLNIVWEARDDADASLINACGGFELTLLNTSSKTLLSGEATYDASEEKFTYDFTVPNAKKCYKVKLTPYIDCGAGVRSYGKSVTFAVVPQPALKSSSKASKSTIKLRWTKVKSAKKYVVYAATSSKEVDDISDLKFKKVGVYKTNKLNLTKIKKTSINTTKYYYYFKIVTKAKVAGKMISSTNYYYSRIHKG